MNMKEHTDLLDLALRAAILNTNIPFSVFTGNVFEDEVNEPSSGWLTMKESPIHSEYAILIKVSQVVKTVESLGGPTNVIAHDIDIFYPTYDAGDSSVGMEDSWIADPDLDNPDFTTDSVVEAAMHCVNWFINNNMRHAINNALEADFWQKDKAARLSGK